MNEQRINELYIKLLGMNNVLRNGNESDMQLTDDELSLLQEVFKRKK